MRHVLSWMQPRDYRAAARTVPVLGAVAITVTLLFLPMSESNGSVDTPLIAVATVGCVVAAVLCGLRRDGYAAEAAVRICRQFHDHIRDLFHGGKSPERAVADLLRLDDLGDTDVAEG